jgi:hypothetical protein
LPVQVGIDSIPEMQALGHRVFVMLNGKNEGIFVDIKAAECLGTLAQAAAQALGADEFQLIYPLRLFSPMGRPVTRWEQVLKADHLLHVLLHEELWVWPGVHVGFTWQVGEVQMTTVAMQPKVILLDNFISDSESDAIIAQYETSMYRSPEKHYSDNPRFHNYRTSETASIATDFLPAIRARSQQITRLPDPEMVENLQLLRYVPGKWYKPHQDLFHNVMKPFEEKSQDGEVISRKFKAWCLVWRNIFYRASQLVKDETEEVPVPKTIHAAANLHFHGGLWYPDVQNKALQAKLLTYFHEADPSQRRKGHQGLLDLGSANATVLDQLELRWLNEAFAAPVDNETLQELIALDKAHPVDLREPLERNRFLTILPYLSEVTRYRLFLV